MPAPHSPTRGLKTIPSAGTPSERRPTTVLPLRSTPAGTTDSAFVPAGVAHKHRPVHKRPWRLLLVPPTPGAPTRTFDVSRWHAYTAFTLITLLFLLAAGSLASIVFAIPGPLAGSANAEAQALRDRLAAAEDSLSLVRLTLANGGAGSGFSPAALGSANSIAASRAGAADSRAKPGALAASARPVDVATLDVTASRALSRIAELPVIGAIVSGFSRARSHPLLHIVRPHLGVDVSAPAGTPITAPAAGRVLFVGRKFSYGLTVEIEHGNGVTTRYAHLRSADVVVGQSIVRGARIGAVGSSGLTTGPHLHYEMIVNGRPVDPLRFRMPQLADSAGTLLPSPPVVRIPATSLGVREDPAHSIPPVR